MEAFLVTRPKMQNEQICEFLQDHGCKAIAEPLCDVEFLKYEEGNVKQLKSSEIQAVFITSYNASKTFLDCDFDRNIAIYAIGKRCVRDIERAGYSNINLPDRSSVLDLEKLFLQNNMSQTGEVLYFRGNFISRDLSASLARFSVVVKNIDSYFVNYYESFSRDFLKNFNEASFENVLCYSVRNAACIYGCIEKSGLFRGFENKKFYAISQDVAIELRSQGFENVYTFEDHKLLKKYYNSL